MNNFCQNFDTDFGLSLFVKSNSFFKQPNKEKKNFNPN